MKNKVVKAYLRHTNRPRPSIVLVRSDRFQKQITKQWDLKTANLYLERIRSEIALGTFTEGNHFAKLSSRRPISELKDKFIKHRSEEVARQNLSPKTLQSDKEAIRIFVHTVGNAQIGSITKKFIQKKFVDELLLNSLNKNGRSYSRVSINNYLKHLSGAFSWAEREGFVEENPRQ